MRENLDAMAQKVGEMQAKLVRLEAMGDRVSGMAGVKPDELKPPPATPAGGGKGGPFVPASSGHRWSNCSACQWPGRLADQTPTCSRWSSRVCSRSVSPLLVPSTHPSWAGRLGLRLPHRPLHRPGALHTGLDFPADVGHADRRRRRRRGGDHRVAPRLRQHGRDRPRQRPVTRYAHASKVHGEGG
jgi:hypothetical protein